MYRIAWSIFLEQISTVHDLDIATAWSNKPVKRAASKVEEFFVFATCPVVLPVSGCDEYPVLGLLLCRQFYPVRSLRGTFYLYRRVSRENETLLSSG